MNAITQFDMLIDAMAASSYDTEVDGALANLRCAIHSEELLIEAVLGEHREHHDFGAATCWSLACRLASQA